MAEARKISLHIILVYIGLLETDFVRRIPAATMTYFDQTIYLIGILERVTNRYFANSVKPSLSDPRWAAVAIGLIVSGVLLLPLAIRLISLHPTTTRPNRRRHLARKKADLREVLLSETGTDDIHNDEHMSELDSCIYHVVQLHKEEPLSSDVAVEGGDDCRDPPALKGGRPNDIIGLAPTGVVYDSGCCRLVDTLPDDTLWGIEHTHASPSAIRSLLMASLNTAGSVLLDATRARADPVTTRRHLGDSDVAPPRLNGGSPKQRKEDRGDHSDTMVMSIIMTAAMWQMHFAQWACLSGTSQLFNERAYRKALTQEKPKTTSNDNK